MKRARMPLCRLVATTTMLHRMHLCVAASACSKNSSLRTKYDTDKPNNQAMRVLFQVHMIINTLAHKVYIRDEINGTIVLFLCGTT